MTWRGLLGLPEGSHIPHWTPQRAQTAERVHYERLGLAGFHHGWSVHLRPTPRVVKANVSEFRKQSER